MKLLYLIKKSLILEFIDNQVIKYAIFIFDYPYLLLPVSNKRHRQKY